MRRAEKEVKDLEQLEEILRDCNTVRIGTQDAEGMFIVPVNYGYDLTEGQLTLYLHSAREGRKAAAFRRGGAVAFEMDCGHMLFTDMEKGNCTMCYESVIGYGAVEDVPEEEKREALDILMEHYPVPAGFHYNEAVVAQTRVLKLTVESMTGKRREKK